MASTITTSTNNVYSQDISPMIDIKTLSELPLEKLLQVKSTFKADEKPDDNDDEMKIESKSEALPEALALKIGRKPHDRGGYHHYNTGYGGEDVMKKSGKKKSAVQSIFQISVTALAFLAFGGYLLCLLVQAIKGKSMMSTTISPDEVMAALNVATKRRRKPSKVQRKPQRNQNRPQQQRPYSNNNKNRYDRTKRSVWSDAGADPDQMYYALVSLSEAYTNYHTVNYKMFNYSGSYF